MSWAVQMQSQRNNGVVKFKCRINPLFLSLYYSILYLFFSLGKLLEGDRILSINGESLCDVSLDHASKLIKEADDTLAMEVEFDVVGKRGRGGEGGGGEKEFIVCFIRFLCGAYFRYL